MKKLILSILGLLFSTSAIAGPIVLFDMNNQPIGTAGNPLVVTGGGGSAGKVTPLTCSDDIQTKINEASSGDTLVLGSCTYSISSTITIDKPLTLIGQGKYTTIIDGGSTSEINIISVQVDGVRLIGMQIYGTDVLEGVVVDATGGNVINDLYIKDFYVNIFGDNTINGFALRDAGGYFDDILCRVRSSAITGTNQIRCMVFDTNSTAEANVYAYVNNAYLYPEYTGTVGGGSAMLIRGIRFYNVTGNNSNSMFLYLNNSTLFPSEPNMTSNPTKIEALHVEEARVYAYVTNSVLNGSGHLAEVSSTDPFTPRIHASLRKDIRCSTNSVCRLQNTILSSGTEQLSGGATLVGYGAFRAGRIRLDEAIELSPSSGAVTPEPLFYARGQKGSDTSATGGSTASVGSAFDVVLGGGGIAAGATTTGTGGKGGSFSLFAGVGGSQNTATSTTNNSGAGGDVTIAGGNGGNSANAATNNNGGAGGSIYLVPGAGGTGATSNGINGGVVVGGSSNPPLGGMRVAPPTAQTIAGGNVITADACGTIKMITSAGAVTTDTTNTFTAPAATNAGCCMDVVNVGANNITLDNNANFFSQGAADVVLGANDGVRVCSSGASGRWYQTATYSNN